MKRGMVVAVAVAIGYALSVSAAAQQAPLEGVYSAYNGRADSWVNGWS